MDGGESPHWGDRQDRAGADPANWGDRQVGIIRDSPALSGFFVLGCND